jgi:hypothetical protein
MKRSRYILGNVIFLAALISATALSPFLYKRFGGGAMLLLWVVFWIAFVILGGGKYLQSYRPLRD